MSISDIIKDKVWNALSKHPHENTVSKLAKRSGLSYMTTAKYLMQLVKEERLSLEHIGNARIFVVKENIEKIRKEITQPENKEEYPYDEDIETV